LREYGTNVNKLQYNFVKGLNENLMLLLTVIAHCNDKRDSCQDNAAIIKNFTYALFMLQP